MKKIIYFTILALLLCTGIAFADTKWEANLLLGSYEPSLARFKKARQVFELNKTYTYGCTLTYQILPECKIHAQIDFSEFEALMIYQMGMKFRVTTISLLSTVDLFHFKDLKVYGGIGLIDYRVKSWIPGFREFACSHNFGLPWGTVVLLGMAIPVGKSYQLEGEVQYVTGADEELYGIPLEWDGFKFLIGIGLKF